jgi:hypothetical protein
VSRSLSTSVSSLPVLQMLRCLYDISPSVTPTKAHVRDQWVPIGERAHLREVLSLLLPPGVGSIGILLSNVRSHNCSHNFVGGKRISTRFMDLKKKVPEVPGLLGYSVGVEMDVGRDFPFDHVVLT